MAQLRLDHSQQLQQHMRLSPQMIQSINLIAMPVEELRERIYEEAEKNPAIEITRDNQWEPFSARTSPYSGSRAESDAWQTFLESASAPEESLQDHLLAQLSLLPLNEAERRIGERIIQNLDDRGYNSSPPESLLTIDDPLPLLSKMLNIVRSLEPKGTACADLRESLLVQAEQKKTEGEEHAALAILILKSHFDVLEKKRSTLICKTLNARGVHCSVPETEGALTFIKSLDPFPAGRFESAGKGIQFAVPEIYVRRANKEEHEETGSTFIIEFIADNVPQIAVSPVYEELSEPKNHDAQSRSFAGSAVQQAKSFIHTLELRTKAIYSAVEAIVLHQSDFFDKGPGHLRPLRMKDIAEEIGVHETTVSRIANGKYVQCEWGVYEIKYFFTNALPHTEQQPAAVAQTEEKTDLKPNINSKESVKHRLKEIIDNREKNGEKKLSDSKLAQLLCEEGICVARRTVAKYRSELNIDSSFDRL